MKLNKKLLITLLLGIVFTKVSFATDLTVICDLDDCDNGPGGFCTMLPAPNTPLFEESGIMPGDTARRVLRVENQGSCDCGSINVNIYDEQLSPTTPASFPSDLFTVIKNGATDVYGVRDGSKKASSAKDLQNAYNENISLGSLNPGQAKSFDWLVTFDPLAGNEYQNARTQFDFDMTFQCGSAPGNSNDDDGQTFHSHDDNDDGGETPTVPTPLVAVASFFTQFIPEVPGVVEGTQTTTTSPIIPVVEPEPEVAGAESSCPDPWFWWVFFLVEVFGFAIIYKLISEKYLEKRKRFYFAWFIDTAAITILYYIYYCPWWDWILAALFGAVALVAIMKKFQHLE